VTRRHAYAETAARAFAVAGGLLFVASLVYGIRGFAANFDAPVRPGSIQDSVLPTVVNLALFSGFALHHSVFARTGIKSWLSRLVSRRLERSVYVWIASALFIVVCGWWQPVPGVAWQVSSPWAEALTAFQLVGLGMAVKASAQLDVWSLAGVRQAFDRPPRVTTVIRGGLYRLVRHPIYLAWMLMVWPAPWMTGTRLVFAVISTAYLALAIPFEERSLRDEFGRDYDAYAAEVRWKMLPGIY
jgi:protein-S-isoprenylcysteine O-methyltransferase Ste14